MNKYSDNAQFATLFKKYRLRSEIGTLSEFGDLLAQERLVYETSLFTRWQNGDRVPKDRKILLAILKIFIKKCGIKSIDEANELLESSGQGYLTKSEVKSLLNLPSVSLIASKGQNTNSSDKYTALSLIKKQDIKTKLKVFFAGSYKGNDAFKKNQIRNLYREIERLGYEHVDTDFLKISYRHFVRKMTKDKKELVMHYFKKMHSLYEADICVFETTYHSIGIGFLIQKAIEEGKPTIILYYQGYVSFFISGVVNDKIEVFQYNDINYKQIIRKALEDASRKIKNRYLSLLNQKSFDVPERSNIL